MPFLILLCAIIGAVFLLPFLPTLIFILLMLYGLCRLLEDKISKKSPNESRKP